MPEEDHTGVKLKIFLAAFLAVICILLTAYAYDFINQNKNYISEESKLSADCLKIEFEVISAKYSENNIFLTIENKASSTVNIQKINIIADDNTFTKELTMAPMSQKEIIFTDFSVMPNMIQVFPDNCDKFAKTAYLQKV